MCSSALSLSSIRAAQRGLDKPAGSLIHQTSVLAKQARRLLAEPAFRQERGGQVRIESGEGAVLMHDQEALDKALLCRQAVATSDSPFVLLQFRFPARDEPGILA